MVDYNTADIREYITDNLNDEELETFRRDYFRNISNKFTTGITKSKDAALIEDCIHLEVFIRS